MGLSVFQFSTAIFILFGIASFKTFFLRGHSHLQLSLTLQRTGCPAFFMPDVSNIQNPVILFDGVCNLCTASVQFVIKRDKKNAFRFASLQSSFGEAILKKYNLSTTGFNSFLLLQNGKVYTKSAGALMVAKRLSGVWPLLYLFIFVPSFIRNSIYDLIARNRYKWFGKKNSCMIPSNELKIRFLA